MSKPTISPADYTSWLGEVKSRIQAARIASARLANREMIVLYWDIGRGIVEKQEELGWGKSVVEQLGQDLRKAYPDMRGFSADNLWRMRQFFCEYTDPGFSLLLNADPRLAMNHGFLEQAVPEIGDAGKNVILEQPVPELLLQSVKELVATVPWGHHLEIMKKVKTAEPRLYYLQTVSKYGWTRKVLLNQIKAYAYGRSLAECKSHNFPAALPEHLAEQAEETLKSSYSLEFLGIGQSVKERELENRLVGNLKDFILELGYGFCFIGRQYRVTAGKQGVLHRPPLLPPLPQMPRRHRVEDRQLRARVRRENGFLPQPPQ